MAVFTITNITIEYACIDRTDNYWGNVVVAHTNLVNDRGVEVVGVGYGNREGDLLKQVNEAVEDANFQYDLYVNKWGTGSLVE